MIIDKNIVWYMQKKRWRDVSYIVYNTTILTSSSSRTVIKRIATSFLVPMLSKNYINSISYATHGDLGDVIWINEQQFRIENGHAIR